MTPDGAHYAVTVCSRQWLNEENYELTCTRPPGFHFLPGQFVELTHQGEAREYTLLSAPDAGQLRFLIKRMANGRMSRRLAEIEIGATLAMSPAKGYLTFRPTDRPVYFVATGVGIAPFVAMAAAGVSGFTLVHGARAASGLLYRQELTAAARQYIPCLSAATESDPPLPGLFRGYVTAWVRQHLEPGQYDFYLCGSREMIRDMTHLLDQSHPDTRIFSEAFT